MMDFAKRNAEAAQILAQQLVEAKQERNAVIEECARVAERHLDGVEAVGWLSSVARSTAAVIRALKDKP